MLVFNDSSTYESVQYVHTPSLHDALPILAGGRVAHQLQVAVVGGDHQRAAGFAHGRVHGADRDVNRLRRLDRRLQVAAVADHVGIGDVAHDQVEAARADRLDQLRGQLRAVHLRLQVVGGDKSEEHTSELQSLMRNSYAVFCLKKKKNIHASK